MNGTIIADVRIYTAAGSLVMQAQVGDKVEGQGNTITRLTRNGVQKLAGTYYLGQTGCVAWDEVTPPPDPTGPTLTHTIKVYSDGSIEVDGIPVP